MTKNSWHYRKFDYHICDLDKHSLVGCWESNLLQLVNAMFIQFPEMEFLKTFDCERRTWEVHQRPSALEWVRYWQQGGKDARVPDDLPGG